MKVLLMSIEQTDVVDFVSIDKNSGDVLLTISDHLIWDRNEGPHLKLLQSKLNSYLRFIESGEIFDEFPEARGRKIVINLVGRFPLSEKAELFIKKSDVTVRNPGIRLQFKLLRPN